MEQHYDSFLTTFYKFIFDLNRYAPSEGTQKALDVYKNLDIAKVIFRTYHLLKDNSTQINNKDETLFNLPFIVLPDIDVSKSWPILIKGQKDKLFTYLRILMIETDILINQQPKQLDQTQTQENKETNDVIVKVTPSLEFDPYVGVGENNSEKFGVNEMFSSLDNIEDETTAGPGLETIMKMTGIHKLVNLSELSEQLKNMKKEDIENATNNIKELLGDSVDPSTTSLITDMLTNISEEMKNNDMGKGDPLKNILNIAESVASKMKPQIENNNIDMTQLLNSTQMFANQCKDKNGKSLFEGGMNPFALLGQFANINPQNTNQSNSTNASTNEEQCTNMLQNLGLDGVDLTNMSMEDMMAQLQKSMSQNGQQKTNKNKNKKKKRRN